MSSATPDLDRVLAIVLQRMRGPILVLLCVYAIGTAGMALMPGVDADGNPSRMNLFHAFYFFTYTATTTGFGEIPHVFTDQQRLWATVCLYMGVVAWLYAIGSIIRLVLHPDLLRAVAERRFARRVAKMSEPFFILCGFGDTGSLLARGLSDHAITAAVLDLDIERINALRLRNYRVEMPGLCADASIPRHLIDAGVKHSKCRAVVVLTGSDEVNLKIAVMTRFLNPRLRIVCRDTDADHRELLETVGDVTLVSPFEIFAQQMQAAIQTPRLRAWEDWLVGDKSVDLENPLRPPRGNWVLCGYGRMGKALDRALRGQNMTFTIIETDDPARAGEGRGGCGHINRRRVTDAGLAEAVGLVAGTDNDEENLRILLGARMVNPNAFLLVRQNHHENELAFNAANANLIMQPSLVLARHILLSLLMPSLGALLHYLQSAGSEQSKQLALLSQECVPQGSPLLWSEPLLGLSTPLRSCRMGPARPTIRDLLRNPAAREQTLDALALVVTRCDQEFMLPAPDFETRQGDLILFCGSRRARHLIFATINNPYTLHYLTTGEDPPRGWLFQWLRGRNGEGCS